MAAKIAMTATAIISSIRVNPRRPLANGKRVVGTAIIISCLIPGGF
jgi:hypothetical protein